MQGPMRNARRNFVPAMPRDLRELAIALETWEVTRDFYRGHTIGADGSISLFFITRKMLSTIPSPRKLIERVRTDGTFAVSIYFAYFVLEI